MAAPCDYRPVRVQDHKIAKTGQPLVLHLIETPDIVATLGAGTNGRTNGSSGLPSRRKIIVSVRFANWNRKAAI